jgi:peroxiredoxin
MAMENYKSLYQKGKKSVTDSMQLLFSQYDNGFTRNFAEFIDSLNSKSINRENEEMAADFTAADLKGNPVQLKTFRDKVVVLNFWGIACGPCIREMPVLNKVVEEFKNNPEVIFLGLALDKTDDLTRFFEKRNFDYTILNNCSFAFRDYQIDGLPIHMVIGKTGKIIIKIKGAQDDIYDTLTKTIESEVKK